MPTGKHMLTQPLRAAGIGRARIQDGFHQRELGASIGQAGAAHHVAHHEHVGRQRQLIRAVAFNKLNAQRAQLVAHGRINTCVTPGDLVARLPRQGSQAAHKCAANAQNVNMHGPEF